MNEKLISTKNKKNNIDLYWKAREFKPYKKTVDWYWIFWILNLSFIFILLYFFDDKIFSIFIFLIGIIANIAHMREPKIYEHRITNDGLLLFNQASKISFDEIESYNIDYEEGEILINTKKKYQKLIQVPFEANQNVSVIEKVLDEKITRDGELIIPFLERLFERSLGL